jgi:hypothetical protein
VDVYAALVVEVGGVPGRRGSVFEVKAETVLASLRGHPLDAVTVYQHRFDNAANGEVSGFWLHFRDRPVYYVSGDGSGQRLHVRLGEPGASVDMEQYGQMRVCGVASGHPLAGLIGHRLMDACPVCSRIQGCGTGLLLRFDHASIIVMEYCDELWIVPGDTPPTVPGDRITIGSW